jgi:uncharacterized protein YjbI with pentapeptide repeats
MDSMDVRQISPAELEQVLRDNDLYASTGAKWGKQADLSHTNLRSADLKGRVLMYVNFEGADLSGADLKGASLQGAKVAGANLSAAIVAPGQIEGMRDWILAFWSQDTLAAIGLPSDHNERVELKDFSGYDLHGHYLSACDLAGANLSGANLRNVTVGAKDLRSCDLAGADVYHAFLEEAKVLPEQAKLTRNWIHARWSPAILAELRLPPNHNDILSDQGQNSLAYDLHDRDLKGSDFTQTILDRVDVAGSDFSDAITPPGTALSTKNWLLARWPTDVLQSVRLPKDHNDRVAERNFESYNLDGRDLSGFDLSKANLRGASLNYAVFANTDLHGTVLVNCVLHNVDLKAARGLRAYQLLGADLTVAALPDAIEESLKSLPGVDESAKNSRKLFLTMLIACLYCWLTILSTTDAAILLGASSLALPIVQTPIPVVASFLAAPVLVLVVYIYLHFSLQHLWELLATLPAIFPDGRPLHERAYPWFMNSLVRTRFPILEKDAPLLPRFQVFCARALAWWTVPFTLLAFWLRFLVRHRWGFTAFQIGLIVLGVWLASRFWAIAVDTLDGVPAMRGKWYRSLLQRRLLRTYLSPLLVLALTAFASVSAFSGDSGRGREVVRTVLEKFGWSRLANLREASLSAKPPNWPTEDWRAVKGGQLSDIVLRNVDAEGSFGVNADLSWADLRGSHFTRADLRGANLSAAKLDGATFYGADLRGADLDATNPEASFRRANLQGAKIGGKLRRNDRLFEATNWMFAFFDNPEKWKLPADHYDRVLRRDFSDYDFDDVISTHSFSQHDMSEVDLSAANLQRTNFGGIWLRNANLSGADLQGANLRSTDLSQTSLTMADLRSADLTGAEGLTLAQIRSAIIDKSTHLPDYLQRQIAFGRAASSHTPAQTPR